MGFHGGSDGELLQCGRPGFDPWVGETPWRRKRQPTPVLLPGESRGQRTLVGCSPWGGKESDTIERLPFHFRCNLKDTIRWSTKENEDSRYEIGLKS